MPKKIRRIAASKAAAVLTSAAMILSMLPVQGLAAVAIRTPEETPTGQQPATTSSVASSALSAIAEMIEIRSDAEMPEMVEVSFNPNYPKAPEKASTMPSITIALDTSTVSLPENAFAVDGYEFLGWSTKADGNAENAIFVPDRQELENLCFSGTTEDGTRSSTPVSARPRSPGAGGGVASGTRTPSLERWPTSVRRP